MEENYGESLYGIFSKVVKLNFYRASKLLDRIGLHPGQAHLLGVIGHEKGISQNQLAKTLNIKPATVTGMIKKLEKAGYIKRRVDKEDQRVLRVYTTEKGKELSKKLHEFYHEIKEECFKNFTDDELVIFRRLLMQMKTNLEDMNKNADANDCDNYK